MSGDVIMFADVLQCSVFRQSSSPIFQDFTALREQMIRPRSGAGRLQLSEMTEAPGFLQHSSMDLQVSARQRLKDRMPCDGAPPSSDAMVNFIGWRPAAAPPTFQPARQEECHE
jgi:hypothetical protein